MNYETNKDYIKLVKKWNEYKEIETMANNSRLQVERELLKIVSNDLKEKGTNNLPLGLKITTGIDEKFDNDCVNDLHDKFNSNELNLPFFPFKKEWKPDSKKMALLKETMPEIFNNTFAEALTIKPKKPSFSIVKK